MPEAAPAILDLPGLACLPRNLHRHVGHGQPQQAQGQQAFELRYDSAGDFYPLGLNARLTPLPAAADAAGSRSGRDKLPEPPVSSIFRM